MTTNLNGSSANVNFNETDMKVITSIIFWALHYDTVKPEMLTLHMNCTPEFAKAGFTVLYSLGIINKADPSDEKEPWTVMYTSIKDIPNDMLGVLQSQGYTIDQLSTAFQGLPDNKKKETSSILKDPDHKWEEIDSAPNDKEVLIRIVDRSKVFMKSRMEIVYMEDMKIAKLVHGVWNILPPFPLFDFSPCSSFAKINEGCEVTHWTELNEGELDIWKARFDPNFDYKTLKFEIDDDKLEKIYRALILASAAINKESSMYPKGDPMSNNFKEAYAFICDLQTCLDRGGDINAVDKE